MTTQSNASCECSGYNTSNGNTAYINWERKKKEYVRIMAFSGLIHKLSYEEFAVFDPPSVPTIAPILFEIVFEI